YFEGYDPSLGVPRDVLSRFDGAWRGRWRSVRVRQVWLSLRWNVQPVLVEDDGRAQPGINYIARDGRICGIVVQAHGGERLHEGRWLAERSVLRWVTPRAQ